MIENKSYKEWLDIQIAATTGEIQEAYKLARERIEFYEKAEIIYDRLVNSHVKSWRKRGEKCNIAKYWIDQIKTANGWERCVYIHENVVTYAGLVMSGTASMTLEQFYNTFEPDEYY